jgi:hypothetical protein
MTAFVENLSTTDVYGSPSSLEKRGGASFSPVHERHSPILGGSADRYERANTFGGSPSGQERGEGLHLRTTAVEKHDSRDSRHEEEGATPVLGGRRGGTPNGPNTSETPVGRPEEEEEKREDAEEEEPNEEDVEANKPQEFKYCFFLKMQICIDKNTEIRKEVLNSNSLFNLNEAFRMFD